MAFLMCAQTALLVSHPHCLHVAVVLLLPRRLYHHARHAPGTLLALPPQGPSCPPSPRLCMGGPGFVLRKPRICRPARSRTCDVAHFGLNLHGAMEETWGFSWPLRSPLVLMGSFSPCCPPRNKAPRKTLHFHHKVLPFL